MTEYWIVDPLRGRAQFYRIGEGGLYTDVTPGDGEPFESQALPGFQIAPAYLFAKERPSAFTLLTELLG